MAIVFFVLASLIVAGLVLFGTSGFLSSVSDIHHKLVSNPVIQYVNSHIMNKNSQSINQTTSKSTSLKGNATV